MKLWCENQRSLCCTGMFLTWKCRLFPVATAAAEVPFLSQNGQDWLYIQCQSIHWCPTTRSGWIAGCFSIQCSSTFDWKDCGGTWKPLPKFQVPACGLTNSLAWFSAKLTGHNADQLALCCGGSGTQSSVVKLSILLPNLTWLWSTKDIYRSQTNHGL
jgi:hypothetical protein